MTFCLWRCFFLSIDNGSEENWKEMMSCIICIVSAFQLIRTKEVRIDIEVKRSEEKWREVMTCDVSPVAMFFIVFKVPVPTLFWHLLSQRFSFAFVAPPSMENMGKAPNLLQQSFQSHSMHDKHFVCHHLLTFPPNMWSGPTAIAVIGEAMSRRNCGKNMWWSGRSLLGGDDVIRCEVFWWY